MATTAAAEPEMQQMMTLAIQQGPDGVDALRQLVELRREEEDRQARRDFAAALALFQSDLQVIEYNAKGAHNARYATLDHVMQSIRAPLTGHGLSVSFDTDSGDDGVTVWCIVRHVGGHSERTRFSVPRERAGNRMNVSQAEGSALTYARRYALSAALNLTTGEVDDNAQQAGAREPVTSEQADALQALAEDVGAEPAAFFRWLSSATGVTVDMWRAIPGNQYQRCVDALERKRAAQ